VTSASRSIDIQPLVQLASRVLDDRISLQGKLTGVNDQRAIEDILRVGTSAGGARAKAVLAWNENTGEFRSGQAPADDGFTQWIMKFDGVSGNRDKELADPAGYGRIEYAYSLMAREAGVVMTECRLHEEGERAHFMTRRFDRTDSGDKLHMQSLGALLHADFNLAGAHSYEQALQTIRVLGLPMDDREQQVLRTYFNVVARNQDDHVKNIAFLMNRRGEWRLSPAFDLTYAYNPQGDWTSQHQMSLNGKRDDFEVDDLIAFAAAAGIKKTRARRLLSDVMGAVSHWRRFASEAGVPEPDAERVRRAFRSDLDGAAPMPSSHGFPIEMPSAYSERFKRT
jgi:serine/threonine-protein kinase HipA